MDEYTGGASARKRGERDALGGVRHVAVLHVLQPDQRGVRERVGHDQLREDLQHHHDADWR